MDYNHIIVFLEKFKKLIFQKEEIKEIVIKTISLEISHQLEKESLKIKNGYIFIQGSPILRSEIMMHKSKILSDLKSILPNNNFLDIK
jgi:thioredoxin-related protein